LKIENLYILENAKAKKVETHLNDKKSLFFHKKFKFLLTLLLLYKCLEKGAKKSNPNEEQRHYQQLVVVMNMNHEKRIERKRNVLVSV
jgi:hypothetical protein